MICAKCRVPLVVTELRQGLSWRWGESVSHDRPKERVELGSVAFCRIHGFDFEEPHAAIA